MPGFPCIWSEGVPFIRPHRTSQDSWGAGSACRADFSRCTCRFFWFCFGLWASLQLVQALVLLCSTTRCPAFFLISYQGNKAAFQTDQMFPIIVTRKKCLINYHTMKVNNSSDYNDWRHCTNKSWRLWSCHLVTYLEVNGTCVYIFKHTCKTLQNYVLAKFYKHFLVQ